MWKLRAAIILLLILLINVNIPHNYDAEALYNYPENIETDKSEYHLESPNYDLVTEFEKIKSSFTPISIDNTNNSWLDGFDDSSGIDWSKSDHLNVSESQARIHIPYYPDGNTVGLWHFDEGLDTKTYDQTLNNNDGALIGGTSWVTGKYNNGLSFDGSNDKVEVPDSPSLSIKGSITITTWIRFSQLPTSGKSYPLVGKIEAGTDTYRLLIRDTGKACLVIKTTMGSGLITSNTVLNDNKWHMVTGTWDKSKIRIYIDGQNDATPVIITGNMKDTPDELRIGYSRVWQGGVPYWWYYKGLMDEVRISNIARSPSEIKDLYENGTPVNTRYANLTSKVISLPANSHWDTLIIDKTKPISTQFNITILDASNGQQISGTSKYTNSGEFDVSFIDPITYPSIKLNATYKGNNYYTPILCYWGISWNESNTWCDSFFGGAKVEIINYVKMDVFDGNVIFNSPSSLRSKSINIPTDHHYDTLIINKTETSSSFINVSVLDAQTNSVIPGFENISDTTINIMPINPSHYPAIKLKATMESHFDTSAILHDWTVNWTINTVPKILDIASEPTVNRTHSTCFNINLYDREEAEQNLTLQVEYKSPIDINWQSDYISSIQYQDTHWECFFEPTSEASLGEYAFRFTCKDTYEYLDIALEPYFIVVKNNKPIIWDLLTNKLNDHVKRLETLKIIINATDAEINRNDLKLDIKYKTLTSPIWDTKYIDKIALNGNFWEAEFSPGMNADIGPYLFNISCNDSDSEVYDLIEITVENNKPSQPEVIIIPVNPKTDNNLAVSVILANDLETPVTNLEHWYRWYKNDFYLPDFENATMIPNSTTVKDDTWHCEVYTFDGDDIGLAGEAEVIIQNSPPQAKRPYIYFEMFEDSSTILEGKLFEIFYDLDNDKLSFTTTGQKNIYVDIEEERGTIAFTPIDNWYGTETITFHANDSLLVGAESYMQITVHPTNDLPRITHIEQQRTSSDYSELEFIVKQDNWLNLTIQVDDIDEDVDRGLIEYDINLTARENFYFQEQYEKIIFHPKNEDVGWHFIKVSVTDNNETPVIIVSQDIRIQVVNLNDPPSVIIIEPGMDKKFNEIDRISFSCQADDIDLSLNNSDEELIFKWFLNKDEVGLIGTTQQLNHITLPPGEYNITIKVEDKAGEADYDYVHIIIEEEEIQKENPTAASTNKLALAGNYLWLVFLLLILIIIIICLLVYINTRKKKEEVAAGSIAYEGQVLQPSVMQQPLAEAVASSQELLSPSSIIRSVSPTTPQLPPVQAYKVKLDYQQKLKLVEERLLQGKISQDTYLSLKEKYENEIRDVKPLPQLPPASETTGATAVAPTSEPNANDQIQPQVQAETQPQTQQETQTNVLIPDQEKERSPQMLKDKNSEGGG